jgi:hypothetical protein
MTRGVAQYLVGSLVLVALAGCGRFFFEERAAWRHEAEVECLKSGSVKESPMISAMRAIDGPGICGADFPFKVAAIGESHAMGFADEALRPPALIPGASSPASSPVPAVQPRYVPSPPYAAAPQSIPARGEAGAPISIHPPGTWDDHQDPSYGSPQSAQQAPDYGAPQPSPFPRAFAAGGPTTVTPTATLACPMVSALDLWITNAVQPASQRWFGALVVEIKQISAYSCRSMNGQRGAPISEHAFGNALDVAAFTLADGRKVTVKDGWNGLPEERGFLHDVQSAACQQFSTVLAPGSNAFHYDHIHIDLARHASGRTICNPNPVPGDVAARRRGDRFVTGSIGPQSRTRAVAGED